MRHKQRLEEGKKGAYMGIAGNIILFFIKFPLGIVGNSFALVADSFHTFSDALSSIVVLIGFQAASKPADEKHHYGHGDAEAITGLVVAMLIVLVGFEVGRASVVQMINKTVQAPENIAIIGAVISIAANWYMTSKAAHIGRRIRSPSLLADSTHHASDALSSVVVLVGIIFSKAGYSYLDPFAGLLVSLFIIKTGVDVGRENIDMLMGRVPDIGLVDELKKLALGIDGVKGVHSVKVHYMGVMANVQMHIEVDREMRIIDADRLSHRVQAKVVSELEDVASALVHVCPCKTNGG
ncbi:MAG: cation diffusion facilitator family transporter [Candidatus Hydrothermarchaeales archaeon]